MSGSQKSHDKVSQRWCIFVEQSACQWWENDANLMTTNNQQWPLVDGKMNITTKCFRQRWTHCQQNDAKRFLQLLPELCLVTVKRNIRHLRFKWETCNYIERNGRSKSNQRQSYISPKQGWSFLSVLPMDLMLLRIS